MSLNETLEQRNVSMTGERIKATCPTCHVRLIGDNCPKCDYVRVKGYPTEPDTDMTPHGFAKEVTFKHLLVDPAKEEITVYEVDYYAQDFVCQSCETDKFVWLKAERTGVYKSCIRCQMTTGVLSQEAGIPRKTYKITPEEALEILNSRRAPDWLLKPIKKILYGKKYIPTRKRPKK